MTKEAKKSKITKSKNSQQLKPQKSSPTDCNKKQGRDNAVKKLLLTIGLPITGIIILIIVAVYLLFTRESSPLISFVDSIDATSEKIGDVWHYSGSVRASCVFDEESLALHEIQTPSDKNDALYCKTETITGRYDAELGSLEIEYPDIDSYSVERANLMLVGKGQVITDKSEIKDYTLNLVMADGVVAFARDFENITESGVVQTAKKNQNGKYTASPQQINGDAGTTYLYRFTLKDKAGKTVATYDLKLVIELNGKDIEVLKQYQADAQNKRDSIRAEWDNAPAVSFDELAKNFEHYKGKLIKIQGTISDTGNTACALDVPKTPVKLGPVDIDEGMVYGRNCMDKGLNGMSITTKQDVVLLGKPYQIIEDDKVFGPFIYIDVLEVSRK